MPKPREGRFHRFKKLRPHAEDGLHVIFKYTGGKLCLTERGNLEDHFKLAAHHLPRRVFNMMAKGEVKPTQSWRALVEFEANFAEVRADVARMRAQKDYSKFSAKTIDRLFYSGLENGRQAFYREIEKYQMGRIGDKGLELFDYSEVEARAKEWHRAKEKKRALRMRPDS